MLDGVSLDQLKTFIASVDEGSFSAAARKLHRAQSVISDLVSALEAQIGVQLFDRSARYPRLTPDGIALLADARGIVAGVDFMRARAKGLSSGLESELSVVVDMHFPLEKITNTANAFRKQFPGTPFRLFVEALGAVHQRVLDGSASVGVALGLPNVSPLLSSERLDEVAMVMVVARHHPLATFKGIVPKAELAKHIQLVLSDKSNLSAGIEFTVISPSIWRFADLFAKQAFLLKGLGWGGMPAHTVERDIAEGKLVTILIDEVPPAGTIVPMAAVYLTASPPGPAGRWFIERLKYPSDISS